MAALRAAATFLHNPRIRSNGISSVGGRGMGRETSAFITTRVPRVSSRPVARGEPRPKISRPRLAFFIPFRVLPSRLFSTQNFATAFSKLGVFLAGKAAGAREEGACILPFSSS